ncbi:membrane metalloprotease [Pontimicrobium aquaticum]|uniref:Membrane metalloprotease n=1 Tax=Pontimicrobium aquaticum TaxID=2565367 RepID=A0A4V5LQZ8_9FLAO|nr:membrane metalloprotease [Pontimicrobium aquaticum]TJY37239.1 membrane metalloprotease [Pontimicrobium aquaticum]
MKKIAHIFFSGLIMIILSCSSEGVNQENPVNNTIENKKTTGSSSNDLLSDDTFTSIIIELVYVENYKPTQSAINNFRSFLEARINKPNGITIEIRAISSHGTAPYSIEDIINIEDENRTKFNTNNQIAVWVFFADGSSASNTNNGVVLGTAYRNTSFVIYEETIQDLSGNALQPSTSILEATVITHEFGHILGLTNLGATLQSNHEDTQHPKHCNVESCLMYWSAETDSGLSNLIGVSSAPELDAQCIADLQANGGK